MAEKKKTASKKKPVEAEVVEPAAPAEASRAASKIEHKKKYRSGSIFWGLAFIIVGSLFLLDNLGIASVNFANLWQLWPVLIIGAGISMLSLSGWLSGLLAILLAVAFGWLAYFVAVDNPYYDNQAVYNSGQVTTLGSSLANTKLDSLDLTLRTGAVNLDFTSSSSQDGFKAELSSNYLTLQQTNSTLENGVQYTTLETASESGWWMGMGMGRMQSNLSIELTQDVPLALHLDTGASSVTADLSSTKLTTLTVDVGASNIAIKLGSKATSQDVTLDAGASKIVLNVPKDSGVRIVSDSGLSHTDFEDVDKVSDTLYESSGFSSAKNQITIHAKIGVSSFELIRY